MDIIPETHVVAALIADPSRSKMLETLMSGRAHTAKELAFAAEISAQTASFHLAKLVGASLLAIEAQGRHRYYRIAHTEVAAAMEAMMALAGRLPAAEDSSIAALPPIKAARFCYDHLAGRLGVELLAELLARDHLRPRDLDFELTKSGEKFFSKLGIDIPAVREKRRRFACSCLDWSEREPHLGGALGCALAGHLLSAKWIRRIRDSRVVLLTDDGRNALSQILHRRLDYGALGYAC